VQAPPCLLADLARFRCHLLGSCLSPAHRAIASATPSNLHHADASRALLFLQPSKSTRDPPRRPHNVVRVRRFRGLRLQQPATVHFRGIWCKQQQLWLRYVRTLLYLTAMGHRLRAAADDATRRRVPHRVGPTCLTRPPRFQALAPTPTQAASLEARPATLAPACSAATPTPRALHSGAEVRRPLRVGLASVLQISACLGFCALGCILQFHSHRRRSYISSFGPSNLILSFRFIK